MYMYEIKQKNIYKNDFIEIKRVSKMYMHLSMCIISRTSVTRNVITIKYFMPLTALHEDTLLMRWGLTICLSGVCALQSRISSSKFRWWR